jgi:hypothetical protein
MENLFYILLVIGYFIYQFYTANKRKAQEELKKRREAGGVVETQDKNPAPPTMQDRMKEIYREMEMKTKPYARPGEQSKSQAKPKPASYSKQTEKPSPQKKNAPEPFLNVDMTTEEVLPEGSPAGMMQDGFEKGKVTNYDYNAARKEEQKTRINLREAMIANVILNRPEW